MAQSTKRAANVWQVESGEDFLQLMSSDGGVKSWIDSSGSPQGNLFAAGGTGSKTLYVDGNRTDSYNIDGSFGKPFKTITAAVNQIIANGDNSSSPYVVVVAPGVYAESIVLSNPALVNLYFIGKGAVVDSSAVANGHGIEAINNDNLLSVTFEGFIFNPGNNGGADGNAYVFKSSTNNTNFLSGEFNGSGSIGLQPPGLWMINCSFNTGNSPAFLVQNAGSAMFQGCQFASNPITFNNVGGGQNLGAVMLMNCNTGGNSPGIILNTNLANPVPNGFSETFVVIEYCDGIGCPIVCGAGSFLSVTHSIVQATITANGTVGLTFSRHSADVVVNNGGSLIVRASTVVGPITVNAGGTYSSVSQIFGVGGVLMSAPAPTAPSGVVGIGNGTAATATAGSGSLPAAPAGFLVINVGGTTKKIPYYNS